MCHRHPSHNTRALITHHHLCALQAEDAALPASAGGGGAAATGGGGTTGVVLSEAARTAQLETMTLRGWTESRGGQPSKQLTNAFSRRQRSPQVCVCARTSRQNTKKHSACDEHNRRRRCVRRDKVHHNKNTPCARRDKVHNNNKKHHGGGGGATAQGGHVKPTFQSANRNPRSRAGSEWICAQLLAARAAQLEEEVGVCRA